MINKLYFLSCLWTLAAVIAQQSYPGDGMVVFIAFIAGIHWVAILSVGLWHWLDKMP